jgi:hypothetical protein
LNQSKGSDVVTTYLEPVTFNGSEVNDTYKRLLGEWNALEKTSSGLSIFKESSAYEPIATTTSGSVTSVYWIPVEQTYVYYYDREMLQLERAVRLEDEDEFNHLVAEMDWYKRSGNDYLKAVKMALEVGAFLTARKLSQEGETRFPNNLELRKYAKVLAPVKTIRTDVPSDPGVAKNNLWLKQNRDEYLGLWVALRDGDLLASGKTLQIVKNQVGRLKNSRILVTRVF